MTSTPTPPPPASPAAPETPALSEGARLIDTFIAPSKTFTDIRRNASWWVPWILIAITQAAFIFVFDQKVGWETFIEQQIAKNPSAQARLEQLPPAQKERALAIQVKFARYLGYAAPVTTLIFLLIASAIAMAIFNFGFGAQIPFKTSMSVFTYCNLPGLIVGLLGIVSLYATSTPEAFNLNNPLATNPAYFLDPANSKLLYWLASCLDVVAIWMIVLMGIGYATVSKVKRGSAIAVFAMLYVVIKGFGALRG